MYEMMFYIPIIWITIELLNKFYNEYQMKLPTAKVSFLRSPSSGALIYASLHSNVVHATNYRIITSTRNTSIPSVSNNPYHELHSRKYK